MPEEERKNTAYHESGHAIVAKMLLKPIRYTRLLSFLGEGLSELLCNYLRGIGIAWIRNGF